MALPDSDPSAFLRTIFGRDLPPEDVEGVLWMPMDQYIDWISSRFRDPERRHLRAQAPPLPWAMNVVQENLESADARHKGGRVKPRSRKRRLTRRRAVQFTRQRKRRTISLPNLL